jgi:hypothetical protein
MTAPSSAQVTALITQAVSILGFLLTNLSRETQANQSYKARSMDNQMKPRATKSFSILIISHQDPQHSPNERRKMVDRQCSCYILAGMVKGAKGKDQSDEIRDQEKDSILLDDGVGLWSWRG